MHRLVINALRCGARSSAQILPFVAALGFLTFSTAPKIGFQTLLQSLGAEEHAPQASHEEGRGLRVFHGVLDSFRDCSGCFRAVWEMCRLAIEGFSVPYLCKTTSEKTYQTVKR